jgi:hypothetical protein
VDPARDANARRLSQRRKARGQVAAVNRDIGARFDQAGELVSWQDSYCAAHQIVAICHLVNIDADAERDAPVWRYADIAIDYARCTSMAHRTASVALANSTSRLSPTF